MNKLPQIVLFVIVFIAIILRFYQLGSNPPSLDWDEASIGYNAYSILKTGADEYGNKLPLSFRSFDDYKPPVYIYLTVPSVALFGLNEFSVRFPAAVMGVIAVVAVYFLVKELFQSWGKEKREWIALCSSLFLAVAPWHLQFSRAAFEGNIGICFLILALLFFFKGMSRGTYFFLFALCLVLSFYSYHSFRLVDPIILVILSILFYKEIRENLRYFGISAALVILCCLPVFFSFFHPQGTGARLSMVTIFSDPELLQFSAQKEIAAKENHDVIGQLIYNRRFVFFPTMLKGYIDHFNFDFLFLHGDGGVQHHAYNMGMLYLWDFPFILIGIFLLLKHVDKKILLLLLLFLLAPLPAAITTGTPHPVRAIAMIPALQIFTAVGFVMTYFYLQRNKQFGKASIFILVITLVCNIVYYLHSYYLVTPIKYGYFWQFGNKQAVMYASAHENEYNHIIMTYAYDQPYIYYLFYNKVSPAWYQAHWNYSGNGAVDRFYRKIGKYEFMNISAKQLLGKKTLLIGTPSEIPNGSGNLKEIINFPDGRTAYKIIAI